MFNIQWNTFFDISTYIESGIDNSPYERPLPGKATPTFPYNLKEMAEDFGYKNQVSGDIVIKHPYTQKEIAALIGTSRPTLNILLNELKEEEYLNFNRKEIILRSS